MSLLRPRPAGAVLAPLLALLSGACATLLDPRPPLLRIRTDTVVAVVRDAEGRTLGTTPFEARLRARPHRTLVIAAPGYDSAVVTVGSRVKPDLPTLLNPLSWPVDIATGAYWTHDPAVLDVRLSPIQSDAGDEEPVSDAVTAVVLTEFADAAEAAGCEPLLVGAWRDAARVLARADPAVPPDSVRREAEAELDRVAPELRDLCTRPSPQVDRLREIRERLAAPPDTSAPDSSFLLAPVFFGPGEWDVRDDSVRVRLRALGARLVDAPVTLVVGGYTDAGETPRRELGVQRAHSVIRELRAAGLAADCCTVVIRDPTPSDAEGAAEARLNRRVVFTLDYREGP